MPTYLQTYIIVKMFTNLACACTHSDVRGCVCACEVQVQLITSYKPYMSAYVHAYKHIACQSTYKQICMHT